MGRKMVRWGLISIIFLIVITVIRLLWINYLTTFDYQEIKFAEKGVLDLREFKFTSTQTLPLNGEWEFYPSALIHPETFKKDYEIAKYKMKFLNIPNTWDSAYSSEEKVPFNYGTYRLRMLLNDNDEQAYSLRINEIKGASATYINNQIVGSTGQVATDLDKHLAQNVPYTININQVDNEADIVIHVSNHTYGGKGGITKSIRFGTLEAINHRLSFSIGLQLLLSIVFMMHIVYALLLFFLGGKMRGLYCFSILMTCAFITVLVSDDKLLFNWFNIPYKWSIIIIYFSYIGGALFLPLTLKRLFAIPIYDQVLRWFTYYCIFFSFIVLIVPYPYIEGFIRYAFIFALLFSVVISIGILIKSLKKTDEYIFLILACVSIGTTILWPIIIKPTYTEWVTYPFDFIFALFALSAFWFQRFFKSTSETKQLAEKLRIENEKKDEFLVSTSHELSNPLHVIMNMTTSILEDEEKTISHTHKKYLEMMNSVSQRMSLILNDLIDITRLKENTIQIQLTSINIRTLVNGVVDMVQFMYERKQVKLYVKIPASFPSVIADENRVIQILFNLIHNAVKFTDKGSVIVRAEHDKETAYIHIEDTGIGIDRANLQRIFQPYEQIDSDEVKASGGFGLGLSICKQLVELQGGSLTAESIRDTGSKFTLSLPLFNEDIHHVSIKSGSVIDENKREKMITPVKETRSIETAATTDGKSKILVVDDDGVNLEVLLYLLKTENYEITTVTSGTEALMSLKETQYDLVISDVMMPNMSGYELTRRIRERFLVSELPVLLLTARNRVEDIASGFKAGANDYVKKPVDGTELKARVRALINLKVSIAEGLRMEGAWLQSQIQPHFLFNTLNSIGALGSIDVTKMQTLLEEFSNYLRLSIDFKNTDPVVSIQNEIELVRSYLYIERQRFGDRVNIRWKIDPNLDDFKIPPLTIQPIVENAIRHGITPLKDGGTVCIHIKQTIEYYLIKIKDDGKGMSQEELKQILNRKNQSEKRQGIGLLNINRRLNQLYGQGLSIKSIQGKETVISFQIPR